MVMLARDRYHLQREASRASRDFAIQISQQEKPSTPGSLPVAASDERLAGISNLGGSTISPHQGRQSIQERG